MPSIFSTPILIAVGFVAEIDALAVWQQHRSDAAVEFIPSFESFIQQYSKSYSAVAQQNGQHEEVARRQQIYEERAAAAMKQNSRENRRWTAGVNKLWDWSETELSSLRGYKKQGLPSAGTPRGLLRGSPGYFSLLQNQSSDEHHDDEEDVSKGLADLPTEVDWRDVKALEQIRSQGACGSCWAIAASTVLQAHTEIHTGKTRTFSAQQLVSCVQNPQQCGGTGGCKGATVELAMDFVMANGLPEEHEVPYMAQDIKCSTPVQTIVLASGVHRERTNFGMTSWQKLTENSYLPLMKALVDKGPVAVSASADLWASYQSGIFDGCQKDAVVNHAIVAVGFGADDKSGDKYWIIQNSWGNDWGENGYIRLLRTDKDHKYCGIDRDPSQGTGCAGGPSEVTVCGMCGVLYDSVVPLF
mmetsp:Transcript_60041/g.127173  ORF Transcript_60041/g.127173 Transcript_60041/m.127173 type:complete len:414 (-) Transcript_60041:563-1804(-)|eukprot:CAMPEP_0206451404 /NCGR_PEP_ID=MMETSP0324_2-20121206/19316_1 /ASSEMBLY_ACC=CAM_ASM_000836 /TAXON_ID=2866 /ORGANISM="Crypthecodinium cohnii, Strain Seligo" /LENGTH=413 /DNA_ID=CAMNT_0053921269 /DNA_START=172 /DNA_END=1413 /DNA_ORIENTATION=-